MKGKINNIKLYFIFFIGRFIKGNIEKDKKYLKILYKYRMKKKLNIDNPQTFNEKLQWLKLYDRNPEHIKMVDKYEAKEYVKNIIGEQYIIKTLGIYNSFDEIDFSKLPNQFVIKCTHDSGGVVICKNKDELDIKKVRKKINHCLKRNYFYNTREWPYKNIKPRILIEEYKNDNVNEDLLDYKLMCFNGRVKCSFVCSERQSKKGLAIDFFDDNWNHMPFERHYRNLGKEIKKPKNFDKMIELAEKLSKDIKFVRVDFYEINGKIYFGEMTFFPGSGFEEFTPEKWDYELGKLIELPNERKI